MSATDGDWEAAVAAFSCEVLSITPESVLGLCGQEIYKKALLHVESTCLSAKDYEDKGNKLPNAATVYIVVFVRGGRYLLKYFCRIIFCA